MYNNYWNQNHDMTFQNAIPSVNPNHQYSSNYVPSNNLNYHYPRNISSNVNVNNQFTANVDSDYTQKYYESISQHGRERQPVEQVSYNFSINNGEDLGNGFFSFRVDAMIDSDEYLTAFLIAPPGMKVISGGWAPQHYKPLPVLESFPHKRDTWVVTVFNPKESPAPRKVSFFLIAKQ